MILMRRIFLNLSLLLCLICCTNCSHNILSKSSSPVEHQTGYLMADRDNLLMQGYTTSFADGYMDGCRSGQNAAGDNLFEYVRDEDRFNVEKDYSVGWEKGNHFCYEHMRDLIRNSSNHSNTYYSKEAIEQEKQRMWSDLKK